MPWAQWDHKDPQEDRALEGGLTETWRLYQEPRETEVIVGSLDLVDSLALLEKWDDRDSLVGKVCGAGRATPGLASRARRESQGWPGLVRAVGSSSPDPRATRVTRVSLVVTVGKVPLVLQALWGEVGVVETPASSWRRKGRRENKAWRGYLGVTGRTAELDAGVFRAHRVTWDLEVPPAPPDLPALAASVVVEMDSRY